jgi:sarcosine oxidase subunit gamma
MAEITLRPRPALAGILPPGRHGHPGGAAGLLVEAHDGLGMVGIAARRGRTAELAGLLRDCWHIELPATPRCLRAGPGLLLWAGAAKWLLVTETDDMSEEARLRPLLADAASLVALGDGRAVLRLAGPRVRDALAKLLPIDLHSRAFRPGDTALTACAGMTVQIWQEEAEPDAFHIAAWRGFAASFCRALLAAGAEYGVAVSERPPLHDAA